MPVSKKGDLLGYFDEFFRGVQETEQQAEYKTAARIVYEFGQYVDMTARSSPNRLHHVYEWNRVGHQDARLFELNITPTGGGVVITYELKKSVTLNDNGQLFADKAEVMESGHVVSFETDKPVPLFDGEEFRVGPFTFVPGGRDTTGAFEETFRTYFMNRGNLIVQRGNQQLPISSLTKSGGRNDGRKFYDRIIHQ